MAPYVAPVPEPIKRATRSSTRSQRHKAHEDVKVRKQPARIKASEKVDKHQIKASSKAEQNATESALNRKQESEELHTKEGAEDAKSDASTPTPNNVTVLTIDSESLKKPTVCHEYQPSTTSPTSISHSYTPFIFTHGAGGTLAAPAVVHFCTGFSSTSSVSILAFQGSMNLGARIRGFHACYRHVRGNIEAYSRRPGSAEKTLVLGGRSMGARAAVIAATELADELREIERESGSGARIRMKLVLVSYPLKGPSDVRDQILLHLPNEAEVLFVIGESDAMCPLKMLEEVRRKMEAKTRLVVVGGADHGMNVKPARRTKEVGMETGRVTARWLAGEIENVGGVLYVNGEEQRCSDH